MNWTEENERNSEIPYHHVKLVTPIGEYVVEWREWKEVKRYDTHVNGELLGSEHDLDSAKNLAENHLTGITNQLNELINQNKDE